MPTTYDRRRPRIPAELGTKIDAARGQAPFDAFVREAVEAALSEAKGFEKGMQADPGPVGTSVPARSAAPPRASRDTTLCKAHGQRVVRAGHRCAQAGCSG